MTPCKTDMEISLTQKIDLKIYIYYTVPKYLQYIFQDFPGISLWKIGMTSDLFRLLAIEKKTRNIRYTNERFNWLPAAY